MMTSNDKVSFTLRMSKETSDLIEQEAKKLDISKAAVIKSIISKEFHGKKSSNQ